MKYLLSLIVFFLLTVNLNAQKTLLKNKEYKKLTKFISSEIKKGGKSYSVKGNSSSETIVSKVKFKGCDVEIEKKFFFRTDYTEIDGKVSPQDTQGDVSALKGPGSTDAITFNLKYLDPTLFTTEPGNKEEIVRLIIETKSEDREIEIKLGKIPRFVSKYKFLIRKEKSEEVLDSFKTLTQMCRAKP